MNTDYEVSVGDYVFGIIVTAYHYERPSGKCSSCCETPDELCGSVDFDYVIKWYTNGDETVSGCSLTEPYDVSRDDLDKAILDTLQEEKQ